MTSHDDDDDLLAALRKEFRKWAVPDPEEMLPTGLQRRFIDEFVALYQRKGLMSGVRTPPLYRCCPNASACWKNREEWKRDWSRVALPWIGPDYPDQGGVVVLAKNMNEYGDLAASFVLASKEQRDFAAGKTKMMYDNKRRDYNGSLLAYGTTRSAASVLDKLDRGEVVDHREPAELVYALRRIARWNAVKCSPSNKQWSKPTRKMWTNCPEMLLVDEFRIARPKVILTFGVEVFAAVERLDGFKNVHRDWPLKRGKLWVDDRIVDVLGLYHASWPGPWPKSHTALIRLLRREHSLDS
jgi:hypothetical protein